ncbi:hypothetical protein [Streptomyces sp. NPDC059009]|uniref:hypothetical protein n=1 Tax=Streptomyces sp. NPDC059009 TaxID=3346694 RepID=UPI00368A6F2D
MDPELTALATAGATALVQQMVTDGWTRVRDRMARVLARGREGDADGAGVAGELDEARDELVAARDAEDEDAQADVLAEWRSRMRRTLRADPEAARELRALLDELGSGEQAQGGGDVHNTVSGGVQHGTVFQGHTFSNVNIGRPPRQ